MAKEDAIDRDVKTGSDRSPGWMLAIGMVAGFMLYLLTAAAVFDFTKPALAYDVETRGGRPVAYGPRPRDVVCPPFHAQMFYEGNEWPFRIFRPVCIVWLRLSGYERA